MSIQNYLSGSESEISCTPHEDGQITWLCMALLSASVFLTILTISYLVKLILEAVNVESHAESLRLVYVCPNVQ